MNRPAGTIEYRELDCEDSTFSILPYVGPNFSDVVPWRPSQDLSDAYNLLGEPQQSHILG